MDDNMTIGALVQIEDHAAAGECNRGRFGIVLNSKLAWRADNDEEDVTLVVNVLIPSTGEEMDFYDWQLREIHESR
tara:strand:- start:67222 stop:67449 length:228 start_codon:yes stop_codon:yes gene_type:complete